MNALSQSWPERQEPLFCHYMLSPAELLEVRAFAEHIPAGHALVQGSDYLKQTYLQRLLADESTREAVQVFGGYGFVRQLSEGSSQYHVGEIYPDVKTIEIYEEASEFPKWIIARHIFGKDVTG